jgi:hypothetical protein
LLQTLFLDKSDAHLQISLMLDQHPLAKEDESLRQGLRSPLVRPQFYRNCFRSALDIPCPAAIRIRAFEVHSKFADRGYHRLAARHSVLTRTDNVGTDPLAALD